MTQLSHTTPETFPKTTRITHNHPTSVSYIMITNLIKYDQINNTAD